MYLLMYDRYYKENENVAQFNHLEMRVTNQICIQEKMTRRLQLCNACYHSVQNLLSSRLLSRSIEVQTYENIILPVALYGCETWVFDIKGRI
jgi:hypothetical protein